MSVAPPVSSVSLARRTAVVSAVVLLFVAGALAAWHIVAALALLFAALLLAVLFVGMARFVSRTGLGYSWSLALSVVLVAAALVGLGWFVGGGVAEQVAGIGEAVPTSVSRIDENVRGWLQGQGVATDALPSASTVLPTPAEAAARVFGILGAVGGVLGGTLIVVVLSLFLAGSPATYREGLLHLVPPARRARLGEVLTAVVQAVRKWLAARLIAMVVTFGIAWAGLTFVGTPFPLGLAVLSGLVVFIPYVGSYLSGAVAILVALLAGPQVALYTGIFYLVQENVLGQIVEPLIEARMTAAPPALLIAGQVVFGALLGIPGILIASPVIIATAVAVQMLYVNDALDDHVHVLGSGPTTDAGFLGSPTPRRAFWAAEPSATL